MKKLTVIAVTIGLLVFGLTTNLPAGTEPIISNIRLKPNPVILGDKCWLTVDFKSQVPLTKVYVYIQYYVKGKPAEYLFQIIDVEKVLPEIAGKTEGEIKTWWLFKNANASKREFRIWAEDENNNISAGLFLASKHQ